jgi:hypothetical protein
MLTVVLTDTFVNAPVLAVTDPIAPGDAHVYPRRLLALLAVRIATLLANPAEV